MIARLRSLLRRRRPARLGRVFTVSGVLRGRAVSVVWREPPGDPPGVQLSGDVELVVEVDALVRRRADVAPTPTGPTVEAAWNPAYVALVSILAALDPAHERLVDGDVPEIPGLDVPAGAVS